MAGSMLFGSVPTSVPQFILFGNWLLEGRFRYKLDVFKSNKIFWVTFSLFVLHLIGLIQTHDLMAGIDDIRIMIPIGMFPLVFLTTDPLTKKEFQALLYLFITGLVLSACWCLFYFATHPGLDPRKAARYMSHIRLGLYVNMGISTLVYLIFMEEKNSRKILFSFLILFFLFFMIKLSLITGLVLLVILTISFTIYSVFKQNVKVKLISVAILLILLGSIIYFLRTEWNAYKFISQSPQNTIRTKTTSGRPCYSKINNKHTENGFYVAINIEDNELTREWIKKSKINILKPDKKGNPLIWNLNRYLASKGLANDSSGVAQLTSEDVKNIENGETNYKYVGASPLRKRVKEFLWEYEDYKENFNPSGNTVLMRLEFWKAAVYIIERNLLFGVGTGDAKQAFTKAYYRTNTNLAQEWRLRSHNQFLAVTVSFGLVGLVVFLFYLFYPIIKLRKYLHPLYFAFFTIAIISFLTEDTLESQSGVTFFAYFNLLFIWLADSASKETPKIS